MMNCDSLNSTSPYQIKGESGTWHYSHFESRNRDSKYYFWRNAVKTARKVKINLSRIQVQRKVSEMEARMVKSTAAATDSSVQLELL